VVVLTADRYVAICRPLHSAQYSTVARVRTAVAAVWTVAAVYNLPRFFERVVVVSDELSTVSSTSVPPTFPVFPEKRSRCLQDEARHRKVTIDLFTASSRATHAAQEIVFRLPATNRQDSSIQD